MAFSISMFALLSNSGSPTATLYSFYTDDRSWTTGETLENGTPAKAKVEVERRSLVSFVLPFLRWLGGAER